jgi:hypothetical protein
VPARVHGRRTRWWLWLALLAGLGVVTGCEPPDTPPALAQRTPRPLLDLLAPDTVRTERIGAGVWYQYLWSGEGPWAVHLVEVDLGRCDLALRTLRARAREAGGRGREAVSSMARRAPDGVLAAVNADFFTGEGAALGTEVASGRVTTVRERPSLAWRPGRLPWIGTVRVEGDSLWAGWLLGADDGETEVVGGFPELLDRGRVVGDLGVSARPAFAAVRQPRTGVGVDPLRNRLWLVVVDGRRPSHSVGMSLPELAEVFQALGAREALNLDGGGSSVMVVRGETRSRPSEEEERTVVNALAVVRDLSGCPS